MNQDTQKKQIAKLIGLLSDGLWHSAEELAQKVNWRFSAAVKDARNEGYQIEAEQLGSKWMYRLALSKAVNPKLGDEALCDRVQTQSQIAGGRPIIRGQSLTVENVLGRLASGETYETLSTQYAWLEPEDVQACLLYAQRLVGQVRTELSFDNLKDAVPQILEKAPYIKLLILFGSRARGDADQGSDWDFALLCDEDKYKQHQGEGWSLLHIWGIIQTTYGLKDDEIDVVDLNECSDLLAHSVVREGRLLYEKELGLFDNFRQSHLITPERLKDIRQQNREKLMYTLQGMKDEAIRS